MSQANAVTVAVIGLGYWGKILINSMRGATGFEVVAVCDPHDENVTAVTQHHRNAKRVSKISEANAELVVISTAAASHYELARQAIAAGSHVFCEKPLTLDPAQARQLADYARVEKKLLFVDHTILFSNSYRDFKIELHKRFPEGGELRTRRCNFGDFPKDVGIAEHVFYHDLYVLEDLFGLDQLKCGFFREWRALSPYQPDNLVCELEGTGFRILCEVSTTAAVKAREYAVTGKNGSLFWRDDRQSSLLVWYPRTVVPSDRSKATVTLGTSEDLTRPLGKDALVIQFEHVRDCLRGKAKPFVSPDSAVRILQSIHSMRHAHP